MSKYSDAALAIKKAAVKYEQMNALAAVLEEIGSLDQVAKESAAAASEAKSELIKAKEELAKAKDKTKAAEAKLADTLEAASAQATNMAAGILRKAEEDAAVILKKAQDESAEKVAQASMMKANLSSEIGGLQKSVIDARAELNSLTAAREQAEKAAADADKKLGTLREKIKALLG